MAVKASGRFVPPSAFTAGTGKAFTGAYAWNAPREAVGRERPLTRDEMRQVQGVLSTINRLPYFLRCLLHAMTTSGAIKARCTGFISSHLLFSVVYGRALSV
jgi:hypothetical protein